MVHGEGITLEVVPSGHSGGALVGPSEEACTDIPSASVNICSNEGTDTQTQILISHIKGLCNQKQSHLYSGSAAACWCNESIWILLLPDVDLSYNAPGMSLFMAPLGSP